MVCRSSSEGWCEGMVPMDAPPSGGGGDENVRQGPWGDAPPSMAVGSGANCPPPAGTPLGTIPREGDVERLKVPVFGGGDEDTGSTVANVGILASGGGAKEASEPS